MSDSATVNPWLERCRAVIQSWQRLRSDGWSGQTANDLRLDISLIASSSDEAGLTRLRERASEIGLFLDSFVSSGTRPNEQQLNVLEALISTLGSVLAEVGVDPALGRSGAEVKAAQPVKFDSRLVFLLRIDESFAAELPNELKGRGYQVLKFSSPTLLLDELKKSRPGVLVIDARLLSAMRTINRQLALQANPDHERVARVVLSDNADLSRRLLAMNAQADAYFPMPFSVAKVAGRIDEIAVHADRDAYRVLIVDDDRSQAMYCDIILRQRGMATHVAHESLKALEHLKHATPELILLDLAMPEISGMELTQIIRERPDLHQVPIIFLSGIDDLNIQFDAISLGGDDFLTKPIRPRHLISAVSARVRKARAMLKIARTKDLALAQWPRLPERLTVAAAIESPAKPIVSVPAPPVVQPAEIETPAKPTTRGKPAVATVPKAAAKFIAKPAPATDRLIEFQAIVPLRGRMAGQYELNLKLKAREDESWLDRTGFAPIAAKFGRLVAIDRWLLSEALNIRAEQLRRGRQLRLFVRQSAASLAEESLLPWLDQELRARKLSGTGLTLEYSHLEVFQDMRGMTQIAYGLSRQGVQVCINRFEPQLLARGGTGGLAASFIKLDRKATAPEYLLKLPQLVAEARQLGRNVVACAIPNVGVLTRAQQAEVDYVQADVLHAPSPEPDYDFAEKLPVG
jgi:DNA-binding response OmpR family regulator/EAL domain-containing protein (putative c-di-GMP-specific phosphodiesterase class I)